MPYTSMQREFKEEIVSVKTIKDNNFHGGDKLHKDSPKYNIKINFNKKGYCMPEVTIFSRNTDKPVTQWHKDLDEFLDNFKYTHCKVDEDGG